MSLNPWTRHQVEQLIEEYKQHPILYCVNNRYYHNRKLRAAALGEILKKIKAVRPETRDIDITKKINGLRTSYGHERRKQLKSIKDTGDASEIYKPALWYYDSLSFLNANIVSRDKSRDETDVKSPQPKMRLFAAFLVFFALFLAAKGQDEYGEKVAAELEIANLELQDDCENLANALKLALITNTFGERIKARQTHGELLKVLSENLRKYEEEVPSELLRNWTFFVKPGDALLREQDWNFLVTYDVYNDELMHTSKVHCKNETNNCIFIKHGYENILGTSRNQTLLKKSWLAWQTLISNQKRPFAHVLNLISKAASQNEREDARSYWEMLIDQDDAYRVADELWDQISPLYFKLQNYVKTRLFRFYNITETDSEIPAYLLGSNFGYDWSPIAGIILPHPLLYQKAEAYLNKMTIQDIYKEAEQLTQEIKLGTFGDKFWTNSVFNLTFCENNLISFCVDEHSELLTCGKTSWTSYLDAFEVAIDITLRNMDYLSLARTNLRTSVIDDAIKGLGSFLAVKNLRYQGIWDRGLFLSEDNEMADLLLTALRVLPRLGYYLAADKWRLHVLENGFQDMEEDWWKYRKEYQGVRGIFNNETDFLADPYMTSNKPYLSKFLGTLLQFQFLEYYKNNWQNANGTIVDSIANDQNFLTVLHERSSTEWSSLIVNYHGFYEISANPLLDHFAPLDTYLDSAPLDQVPVPPTTTPEPTTTITYEEIQTEKIESVARKIEEATEPPLRPKHEHVEENLEGPNPVMGQITMWIGLGLLVGVAAIIVFVVVNKKVQRRKRNNRRFES